MQSPTPIVKRTQMRRQEQSLPVMERMPDLSLPMTKQTKRQQVPVMKKRKWLFLLRVLDILAVREGGHRRRVGWMTEYKRRPHPRDSALPSNGLKDQITDAL